MSRPQILAILIGIGLIAFGLLYGEAEQIEGEEPRDFARAASVEDDGAEELPGASERGVRVAPGSSALSVEDARGEEIDLVVDVRIAGTGAAASGAVVGFWRAATGSGPAYRSARRLITPDLTAGANGLVRVAVPRGVPIQITARTADRGPAALLDLEPLGRRDGPEVEVEMQVEPPPPPLAVRVVDRRGEPIPGAGLYVIDQIRGLWSEFPGPAKPALRTDGDGRCVLEGDVRSALWLAVDAAGKAPLALRIASIGAATSHEFVLDPEVRAEVHVVGGEGEPVPGTDVELRFELDGYAVQRNARTNSRGRAEIRNLPFGVEVTPVVGTDKDRDGYLDGEGQAFAPMRFNREQTVEGSEAMAPIELVIE